MDSVTFYLLPLHQAVCFSLQELGQVLIKLPRDSFI